MALITLVFVILAGAGLLYFAYAKKKAFEPEYLRAKEDFKDLDRERELFNELNDRYTQLKSNYKADKVALENNEAFISQFNIGIGTIDKVTYTPLEADQSVDHLKSRLDKTKDELKALIKQKNACICSLKDVTVNGKKSEANKLINREIKLRIRCFDNEVKSAIALANWNNIDRLLKRIDDAFDSINERGDIIQTKLQSKYKDLKKMELRLSFELEQAKQDLKEAEREEKRIAREIEREEGKIKAAAEKAVADRERMDKLIKKEMAKLDSLNQEQRDLLEQHKKELSILREREQRAVSMAQTTRAGYVYVISNPLSFGEDIVKVGMTRRVDPYDRVRELGDASVPDTFNVHALFYTEDAPTLESKLHKQFDDKRVNLVNRRKEFFKLDKQIVIDAAMREEGVVSQPLIS